MWPASACPRHVLEQLDEAGLRILNLYGMTEIGAATCCRPGDPADVRYRTVGRPLPGYEVRVVRDSLPWIHLPERQAVIEGEVQVRGPYVTPGYFRQPDRPRPRLTVIGSARATWAAGRARQSHASRPGQGGIQVGGLNVFPAEVEGFLLTHPDVLQAVVVGAPHPTMGEVPRRLSSCPGLAPDLRRRPCSDSPGSTSPTINYRMESTCCRSCRCWRPGNPTAPLWRVP